MIMSITGKAELIDLRIVSEEVSGVIRYLKATVSWSAAQLTKPPLNLD